MVVVYYDLGESIEIASDSPWMLLVSPALKAGEVLSVVVGYGDSHWSNDPLLVGHHNFPTALLGTSGAWYTAPSRGLALDLTT